MLSLRINTSYYGINVYGFQVKENDPGNTEFKLDAASIVGAEVKLSELATDVELMNSIRSSTEPAVKDLFNKLLTTMALTR